MFFLIGTVRCALFTSIFGSLGDHFGGLEVHFGVFLEALTTLGAQLGHFEGICRKRDSFFRRSAILFGVIFCNFSSKLPKMCKKWVSGNQLKNESSSDLTRSVPMWDLFSNYHIFWEVQPCPLGWLLAPVWVPFGVIFGDFGHQWPDLVFKVPP